MFNLPLDELKKRIREQKGLSESEINEKIQEKMNQLSGLISEEGACHIVANELNVKLVPDAENRKVKDLLPGMRDVDQDMKVISVYELRTFESKFGGEGKVKSLLAGDDTGVIRVTCWGSLADEAHKLEKDDIIRVKNGYIKENRGRAELHLNNNSKLERNPKGVEIETRAQGSGEDEEYLRKSINELSKGDYRVEILGTIVQVYDPRFFDRKDGSPGVVTNVLLDDGTGNIRCACWGDQAAKILGLEEKALFDKQEDSFEAEKTKHVGAIVKVQGRAKLNTVYNTIELNVDSLDLSPEAKEELERLQADDDNTSEKEEPKKEAPKKEEEKMTETAKKSAETKVEKALEKEQPEGAEDLKEVIKEVSKKNEKPQDDEEDAISLDDLDDLDDLE